MNTQEFLAILEKMRKEKKKFSDPYFKNSNESLCRDPKEFKNNYEKYEWKRLTDIEQKGG